LIRTFAGEHPDEPELVLAKVNRRILADTHGGLFITVFYAVLNTITGVVKYCNAGHNPPYLFSQRDGDSPIELSRTGMPLGILDEADWQQGKFQLGKGDLLVCYTDGITESQDQDGQFFGEERLAELVQSASELPVVDIQNLVLNRIREFSGSSAQFDDMTLLVVKRN
jgi:sigma-B regulation protein RsbU (phosphoserine phosphatase)